MESVEKIKMMDLGSLRAYCDTIMDASAGILSLMAWIPDEDRVELRAALDKMTSVLSQTVAHMCEDELGDCYIDMGEER